MNTLIERMAAAQYEVVRQRANAQNLHIPLWLQCDQKDRDFVVSHVRAGLMEALKPTDAMLQANIESISAYAAKDIWVRMIKALLAEGPQ